MKQQLLFSIFSLVFILGYSASFGQSITPPKGKGGTSTCKNSGTSNSTTTVTCSNGNNGPKGTPLPYDFQMTIEHYFSPSNQVPNPADFPDQIDVHVVVTDINTSSVVLDYSKNLSPQEIYSNTEPGRAWTEIDLPYSSLEGTYSIMYTINSTFCSTPFSCTSYSETTGQLLNIIITHKGLDAIFSPLLTQTSSSSSSGSGPGGGNGGGGAPSLVRKAATSNLISLYPYPNPSKTGEVNFNIEGLGLEFGSTGSLYIRDELGKLLDIINLNGSSIKLDLNRYAKASNYIYQLIVDQPTGKTISKTGMLLYQY